MMDNASLRRLAGFLGACALASASALATAATPADPALVARGEYLARAADCGACHTAPGGKPFGGGYAIAMPFGTVYGSNISSDPAHGIGAWSDAQFLAAVREGKGPDGLLYPAMPYDSFAHMTTADVLAIKAYLMSQPGVDAAPPANRIAFPFNQRWGMWFWNALNLDRGELKDDPAHTADWNRGRYVVDALAHCAACHSPRTLTMAMDKSRLLAGGQVGPWTAYNITPDPVAGIGAWSDAELAAYLRTGFAPGRASASGPMAEAVEHSLQYLSDADVRAVVGYLRSVPARRGPDGVARSTQGRPATDFAALRGQPAADGRASDGSVLFVQNCATCHGPGGAGQGQGAMAYPALLHHSAVGASNAGNLVAVILSGVDRRVGSQRKFMPAFGKDLDDAQIASLANYLRRQFGGPGAATTAGQVAKARAALVPQAARTAAH